MNELALIKLETKFSHHENEIAELRKIVFEQQLTIAKFEKSLMALRDFIQPNADIGPGNEKPPHY